MAHARLVTAIMSMVLATCAPAFAQQRPLVTEDPEVVGAGRLLIEGGFDALHDQHYPVSGLEGNVVKVPTLGISVGLSSIAEFQLDGGPYDHLSITKRSPAPLASLVTATGDSTHDVEDIFIGMKIRFLQAGAQRPAMALRFSTKLPNASNESGLGTDSFDFYASLLAAHDVESLRIVGNLGVGILADPTSGNRQNDVLTYGLSIARAVTNRAEVVGEVNGRASTRTGGPLPGTESRGTLRLGARYTPGPIRFDGGVMVGLTSVGPTIGITAGFTYVFDAFRLP